MSLDFVYDLLGAKQRYASYTRYVELGLDEEIRGFYSKENQAAILGVEDFVNRVKAKNEEGRLLIDLHQGNFPGIKDIIDAVAKAFGVETIDITKSRQGRGSENIPRWVALYLCRELSQATLKTIAGEFSIVRISGVSKAVSKLRLMMDSNQLIENSGKVLYQHLTP